MTNNNNKQTIDNTPNCACSVDSRHDTSTWWQKYKAAIFSLGMLLIGLMFDNLVNTNFFTGYLRAAWYMIAYIPVALPVLRNAGKTIVEKDFFNEFTLMSLATIGAFIIGEYPEAVGVMLFYTVGEYFQDSAVDRAKKNIKDLLDTRSVQAVVLRDGKYIAVEPQAINPGETIQIKVGEQVALDGILLDAESSFDTSALTGESTPRTIRKGEQVLAGMLNLGKVITVEVTKKYADSSLSRILEMVQDASSRKAKTELLIRKFARIYTPIIFASALLLVVIPYFVLADYELKTWIYRALVFLVISCPCALVISIPLGYFGGIGAASRNGILFKGANYLDLMTQLNTIVMDKTGTLTKGVFKVKEVVPVGIDKSDFVTILKAIESYSNHPIARAISEYRNELDTTAYPIDHVEEIAGYGLKGMLDNKIILAGNTRLMRNNNIPYDTQIDTLVETTVVMAIDHKYVGYITIADEVKEDSAQLINQLHLHGVTKTVMLSGDKDSIVQNLARELNIDAAYGDLLPQDKLKHMEALKAIKGNTVAFVGDGINDTPVLALSDIGIAMGAMGADAAIEVADVIIQTDQPSKIITALKIAKKTKQIIIQNIALALVVKVAVLLLGVIGLASMWGAVFADVGVSLLAILNAIRVLKYKYE